jgi:hypothetical protein
MDTSNTFLRLRAGVALLALAFATLADAQDLRFDQKYIERIKQSQDIGRLSVDSFGEQISLKNGAVEFNWTDIDIPGIASLLRRHGHEQVHQHQEQRCCSHASSFSSPSLHFMKRWCVRMYECVRRLGLVWKDRTCHNL